MANVIFFFVCAIGDQPWASLLIWKFGKTLELVKFRPSVQYMFHILYSYHTRRYFYSFKL